MFRKTCVAIKSETRHPEQRAEAGAVPPFVSSIALAGNEAELLAEIERLRREVDRLSDELRTERFERSLDLDIDTIVTAFADQPPPTPQQGRSLIDGRFIPAPVVDGGTAADPEPGAPRVAVPTQLLPSTSCEFEPDDESATAFDEFFNSPDPQLEKIRQFLLD